MKLKSLPYHLGLAIPVSLILVNGISTYRAVIRHDSVAAQRAFWAAYAYVWVAYAFAIFTSPGYTDGRVEPGGKYVQCLKCNRPKPERAHHCQTCGRCVLRMDHHCPWTENCVGFRNMPHFVRFLTATVLLNFYGMCRTAAFLVYAYEHRRYLYHFVPDRNRLWWGTLAVFGDLFAFLTLLVLWVRVVYDTANGRTQIEVWEAERADTLARRKLGPAVEFPFDVDLFTNITSACGEPWLWALPWATPAGSGHTFDRLPDCDARWPPLERPEVSGHDFYRRDRWTSADGDGLQDFGVDFAADLLEGRSAPDHAAPEPVLASVVDEDVPLADLRSRRSA